MNICDYSTSINIYVTLISFNLFSSLIGSIYVRLINFKNSLALLG